MLGRETVTRDESTPIDGDGTTERAHATPKPIRWPRPSPEPHASSTSWPRAAANRSVRASSPGGSGCPKSSIANICGALADAGLVRRIGTGFALGRRLAELGGAYLASVDQVQEFYEASRQPAGRLGGDGPVRGPRRARGHLSRAPRRPPARPADVGDRPAAARLLDRDRQGRPRLARRRRARAPPGGRHDLAAADPQGARARSTSCSPTSPRSGGAAMRSTTRRPWRVSSATASWSRAGSRRGEGPCAASITLLKVRATAERVPALIADLHWLANELSDPIRRD